MHTADSGPTKSLDVLLLTAGLKLLQCHLLLRVAGVIGVLKV